MFFVIMGMRARTVLRRRPSELRGYGDEVLGNGSDWDGGGVQCGVLAEHVLAEHGP